MEHFPETTYKRNKKTKKRQKYLDSKYKHRKKYLIIN